MPGDDLEIPIPLMSDATDRPNAPQHPAPPMSKEPRSWAEVSKHFDPHMPKQTYDLARRQYFDSVVRPRLSRNDNPLAAWNAFQSKTERPELSATQSLALRGAQVVGGAAKGAFEPFVKATDFSDKQRTLKAIEEFDKKINMLSGRYGLSTTPKSVAEFAGSVAPFAVGAEAVELSELPSMAGSALGQRLIRGSLSLGTFEAANAKEGERLTMGAKGALLGAGFEGALGLVGKLMRRGVPQNEVDQIVSKVMQGEPVAPETDRVVAESIDSSARASREEGRPKVVQENPNVKGINLIVKDGNGNPQIIKVETGRESRAIEEARNLLKTGGEVEGIHFHPDEWSGTQKFMSRMANESEEKFKNTKVIRTTEHQAPAVAAELNMGGSHATATDSSTVVVQPPVRLKPTNLEMESIVQDLKDEEGYVLPKGARQDIKAKVASLWSEAVPTERKQKIAQELGNWPTVRDLVPSEWQVTKPTADPLLTEEEQLINRAAELGLNEEELAQLEGRLSQPGKEEIFGKGEAEGGFSVTMHPVQNLKIPTSERISVNMTPRGPNVEIISELNVGRTPRRYGVKLSDQQIEDILPGSRAITTPPVNPRQIGELAGEQVDVGGPKLPAILYSHAGDREMVYHEGLHVDAYHAPSGKLIISGGASVPADTVTTMDKIGAGLSKYSAYDKLRPELMREEAYVHAATAIRTGDDKALAELVKYDTSIEHVTDMVHQVSDSLLAASRSGIDSAPSRVLQRKMQDMLLRTGSDRMWELKDAVKNLLSDAYYDPDAGVWKSVETNGAVHSSANFQDLANFINERNGNNFMPSATLQHELMGVRGPITPRGGSPIKEPPAGDTAPDTKWRGWTAISGLFRPMQPWVADLDKRVNDALFKEGRKFPIFEKWKDLSEADRAYEAEAHDLYDKAADLLQGAGKKQYDYFEVLTTDPKHWQQMADKLKLSEQDLNKIAGLNNWLQEFKDRTNINPFNYLRDELPRLRGHNYNSEFVYGNANKLPRQMTTFERLISQGKLDPKNKHIGSFMDTMIREARSQKLRKPIQELQRLTDMKAKDGSYMLGNMRYPLENYLRYMQNIPDVTGQVMKQTVGDFQRFLGEKAAQLNKHLPDKMQLPTEFAYPGSIINKLMVWSYAAGLGLRASIPVRDALQVFSTTMPVMGPRSFGRGLTYFAQNGWKFAEESGALLGRKNMGDLYGDIFSELPPGASTDRVTRLAQKLLSPSRGGHNIGRAVGFYGEYFSALDAIRDYHSGRIDIDQLVKDRTSLWFNDKPLQSRMIDLIHTTAPEEAAKQIALEHVDMTLWPYRRGMQPTLLRTGAGRIFGQFGMWPMNYLDFIRRAGTKFAEYPQQATQASALWVATNYAAVQSMQAMGADADKWFFVSPAGYGLSPHAQFVLDLGKAWEETPDGRDARKRVLEYPLDFFPAGIEARNIERVLESGEEPFDENGHPTPALVQILGFKPLKEQPERDMEEQIKFELGLSGQKRRPQ